MTELSLEEIIHQVRIAMEINQSIKAQASRVQRIDRINEAYYLLVFFEDEKAIAVAITDTQTGRLQNSARLSGGCSPLSIKQEQAISLAKLGGNAQARLVWKPCHASLSPLYPLWQVNTRTKTVYVDQQGIVWQDLESMGRGG